MKPHKTLQLVESTSSTLLTDATKEGFIPINGYVDISPFEKPGDNPSSKEQSKRIDGVSAFTMRESSVKYADFDVKMIVC